MVWVGVPGGTPIWFGWKSRGVLPYGLGGSPGGVLPYGLGGSPWGILPYGLGGSPGGYSHMVWVGVPGGTPIWFGWESRGVLPYGLGGSFSSRESNGKGYCNQPAERIRMALPGTQKEIPSPRPLLQNKNRKNSIADPRPTK